jgi:DNA-binding Lrp family transcriptional regulator
MIDEVERKIIHYLQEDLPVTRSPFGVLADKIGIREEVLIKTIRSLRKRGILRRFGATLRHRLAGFDANAMVAWRVPEGKTDEAGTIMAAFKEVSHCYLRRPQGEWPFNLFTMIHGKNRDDCDQLAKRMADRAGVSDYVMLFTLKEYKKTSPKYF